MEPANVWSKEEKYMIWLRELSQGKLNHEQIWRIAESHFGNEYSLKYSLEDVGPCLQRWYKDRKPGTEYRTKPHNHFLFLSRDQNCAGGRKEYTRSEPSKKPTQVDRSNTTLDGSGATASLNAASPNNPAEPASQTKKRPRGESPGVVNEGVEHAAPSFVNQPLQMGIQQNAADMTQQKNDKQPLSPWIGSNVGHAFYRDPMQGAVQEQFGPTQTQQWRPTSGFSQNLSQHDTSSIAPDPTTALRKGGLMTPTGFNSSMQVFSHGFNRKPSGNVVHPSPLHNQVPMSSSISPFSAVSQGPGNYLATPSSAMPPPGYMSSTPAADNIHSNGSPQPKRRRRMGRRTSNLPEQTAPANPDSTHEQMNAETFFQWIARMENQMSADEFGRLIADLQSRMNTDDSEQLGIADMQSQTGNFAGDEARTHYGSANEGSADEEGF